jgi:hypothetical protein
LRKSATITRSSHTFLREASNSWIFTREVALEELAYVLKGGLELVDIHEGDSSNGKTVYFTMRDALASN